MPNWPSGTELEILRLLRDGGERYGLQLVRDSVGALKRGTVYVLLDRLEKKGFIESRLEAASPPDYIGIPRRLYKINGVGVRALNAIELAEASMAGTFAGVR